MNNKHLPSLLAIRCDIAFAANLLRFGAIWHAHQMLQFDRSDAVAWALLVYVAGSTLAGFIRYALNYRRYTDA